MRKINRLRKFIWDAQKKLDPNWVADWDNEEQWKYRIVYVYSQEKYQRLSWNITDILSPTGSKKAINYVVEKLNSGEMKL